MGSVGTDNSLVAVNTALDKLRSKGNDVVDYSVLENGALLALIKSKSGNYSIRQAFYSPQLESYNGFSIYKNFRKNLSENSAQLEFEDVVSVAKDALRKRG